MSNAEWNEIQDGQVDSLVGTLFRLALCLALSDLIAALTLFHGVLDHCTKRMRLRTQDIKSRVNLNLVINVLNDANYLTL